MVSMLDVLHASPPKFHRKKKTFTNSPKNHEIRKRKLFPPNCLCIYTVPPPLCGFYYNHIKDYIHVQVTYVLWVPQGPWPPSPSRRCQRPRRCRRGTTPPSSRQPTATVSREMSSMAFMQKARPMTLLRIHC